MITLEQLTTIQAPIERCFDLARSVEAHLAGNIHFGEQALAIEGITSGLIGPGPRVTWRAKHFLFWHNLTSEITAFQAPVYFQDTMTKGPFRSMQHDHFFQSLPSGGTEMKDVFRFAAPIPLLGRLVEILLLRQYMESLLRERNQVLMQIAEGSEWKRYLGEANAG
jgi:ligand-binding SRPBCC domain-containing protein